MAALDVVLNALVDDRHIHPQAGVRCGCWSTHLRRASMTSAMDCGEPVDLTHIRGQEHVKRGLEVTAAGGHHVLLVGAPEAGKTTLARMLAADWPTPVHLFDLESPRWTERERDDLQRAVRDEIEVLWLTGELKLDRPTVDQEVDWGLYFFEENLFDVVPALYVLLNLARIPSIVRHGLNHSFPAVSEPTLSAMPSTSADASVCRCSIS